LAAAPRESVLPLAFYGFSTRRTVNLQLKTLVIFRKFMEPFCSSGVDKNRKNSEFSPLFEVSKRQRRGILALPLIFYSF
jgi:hypothetical protein